MSMASFHIMRIASKTGGTKEAERSLCYPIIEHDNCRKRRNLASSFLSRSPPALPFLNVICFGTCIVFIMLMVGCTESQSTSTDLPSTPSQTKDGAATGVSMPDPDSSPSIKQPSESKQNRGNAVILDSPVFRDVASDVALDFTYDNGASPQRLMVEATGGGAGWLDFDRDSFWDLYYVQGGGPQSPDQSTNPSDQLYRNLRGERFQTNNADGVMEQTYSQGIAVGDFDGDGFDDVYVTNVGRDTLLQNQGDGTFVDITMQSLEINLRWASSAAWADVDQDGDLDLFVCNYVKYDPNAPIACFGDDGRPGICHPRDVDPIRNCFYLNNGDGTFEECLTERGLDGEGSKSLGVVIADFNGDGKSDIYVANDTTANHLFVNQGNGSFVEDAVPSGCAASGMGQLQASMGIGFGDYDNDGLFDLYLAHFTSDSNTLYRGLPGGTFDDTTRITGMHKPTMNSLAFGTVMQDFNADGAMDLFIANGHIDSSFQVKGDAFEMPAQLFSFDGRQWQDMSSSGGPYFREKRIGRAVALADYNNDGAVDITVVNQNKPVALLKNETRNAHWLKLVPVGTNGNRRGIGVEVVVTQGDKKWRQQLAGGSSYCATHQSALFFGLGVNVSPCEIRVRWESGKVQQIRNVQTNQEIIVLEREAS